MSVFPYASPEMTGASGDEYEVPPVSVVDAPSVVAFLHYFETLPSRDAVTLLKQFSSRLDFIGLISLRDHVEELLKLDIIVRLPINLTVLALSFLSKKELLVASMVSKRWYRLCRIDSLWKQFCLQEFGGAIISVPSKISNIWWKNYGVFRRACTYLKVERLLRNTNFIFDETGNPVLTMKAGRKSLLYSNGSGSVVCCSVKDGRYVGEWKAHVDNISAMHNVGARLITSGFENSLKEWNLVTGRCVHVFDNPDCVRALCFVDDFDEICLELQKKKTKEYMDARSIDVLIAAGPQTVCPHHHSHLCGKECDHTVHIHNWDEEQNTDHMTHVQRKSGEFQSERADNKNNDNDNNNNNSRSEIEPAKELSGEDIVGIGEPGERRDADSELLSDSEDGRSRKIPLKDKPEVVDPSEQELQSDLDHAMEDEESRQYFDDESSAHQILPTAVQHAQLHQKSGLQRRRSSIRRRASSHNTKASNLDDAAGNSSPSQNQQRQQHSDYPSSSVAAEGDRDALRELRYKWKLNGLAESEVRGVFPFHLPATQSQLLVTGHCCGSIRVICLRTRRILREFIDDNHAVAGLKYVRGSRFLLSAAGKQLIGWDMDSGTVLRRYVGQHDENVSCFDFDGKRLVSCDWKNSIVIWDVITGACLHKIDRERTVGVQVYGPVAACIVRKKQVLVIDLEELKVIRTLEIECGMPACIQLDEKQLLVGTVSGHVVKWAAIRGGPFALGGNTPQFLPHLDMPKGIAQTRFESKVLHKRHGENGVIDVSTLTGSIDRMMLSSKR